jgi:hypothetical protein
MSWFRRLSGEQRGRFRLLKFDHHVDRRHRMAARGSSGVDRRKGPVVDANRQTEREDRGEAQAPSVISSGQQTTMA